MFIRWQSRTHLKGGDAPDVLRSAILVRSVRIGGKPRQQHVAYLGSIHASHKGPFVRFWCEVDSKLKELGKEISLTERRKVESALAKKVKRPTVAQRRKYKRDWGALMKSISQEPILQKLNRRVAGKT